MNAYFCDTPTCPVYTFTMGHVRLQHGGPPTLRDLPVCPVCGDLGDSLDENGNPPPSEVSQ